MVFGNVLVWLVLVCGFCLDLSSASGFCSSAVPESHGQHHHCDHGHDHRHHHKHHAHEYHQHHHHKESLVESKLKLPEELAEEEDMRLYGFGFQHDLDHDHDHEHLGVSELSGVVKRTQPASFYCNTLEKKDGERARRYRKKTNGMANYSLMCL